MTASALCSRLEPTAAHGLIWTRSGEPVTAAALVAVDPNQPGQNGWLRNER
jgi:hypothetical protein